jgi:WD40 repeat protein
VSSDTHPKLPTSEPHQPTTTADGIAAPLAQQPTLAAGSTDGVPGRPAFIGDYEILDEIARGGMGVVFRARQLRLNRPVALKMILGGSLASPTDVQRFRVETESAAALDHPNVVPIYEVGEYEGRPYFTMKYVEGGNLAERKRGPASTEDEQRQVALLVSKIARAVHYAHQRGILHRDVKPANILIDAQGEPHVTDFGLAKRVNTDSVATQTGMIVGTPSYMAPEQACGQKNISTAVDIYSLGAILYELLTGRPPFRADSPLDTVMEVVTKQVERPTRLNPQLDRDLETICLKCLEKDPWHRYASAEELAQDLERWRAGEPILARPATIMERAVKWARRRPAVAALLALSAGSMIGLVVFLLVLLQHAEDRAAAVQNLKQAKRDLAQMQGEAGLAKQDAEDQKKLAEDQKKLAETQKKLAEEKRQEVERLETKAKLVALEAQHTQYAADIQYASAAWEADNLPQMLDLLERYLPVPGAADLRGFEWHYLWQQANLATRNWQAFSPQPKRDSPLLKGLPPSYPLRMALSGDGKLLAVLRQDVTGNRRRQGLAYNNIIKLWDIAAGEERGNLPQVDGPVFSIAFDKNGKHLRCLTLKANLQEINAAYVKHLEPGGTQRPTAKMMLKVIHELHLPLGGGDPQEMGIAPLEHWPSQMCFADAMTMAFFHPAIFVERGAVTPMVYGLAPDGKTLAIGGFGFSFGKDMKSFSIECIQMYWDMKADRPGKTIAFDEEFITALAYAPTGSLLATAHLDGTVRLWDTAAASEQDGFRRPWGKVTSKPRSSFRAQQGMVSWVSFAQDGKSLVTGASNGTVKWWDAATGQLLASFKGHKERICAALLTPNGQTLITADGEGLVKFWATDATHGPRTFRGPRGNVIALQFSTDSRTLVSVGNKGRVQRFDLLSTRKQTGFDLPIAGGPITLHAALSEGGQYVVAPHASLQMFETATAAPVALAADLKKHFPAALALSPDANRLAVLTMVDKYYEVRVLERDTGAVLFMFKTATKGGKTLAFGPGGRLLALVDMSGQVEVWDIESSGIRHTLKLSSDARNAKVAFSPQGDYLACSDDKSIYLFETHSWKKLWQVSTYWHHPVSLAFSHDGKRLASGGGEGELEVGGGVKLWDVATGRELLTLGSASLQFSQVAFSPDGTKIAAASSSTIFSFQPDPSPSQIWIWEVPAKE